MGRSFKKFANIVKEAQMRWMFRGGDGAPTVAIEVGVESGNVKEGQPVFKGTRLLFQYPRTIRMLLALQSDGRAYVVHLLEAALVKLESMLQVQTQAERAAQPTSLERAHIHSVDASTYEGNDLGPIGMGDNVTRKGQTARWAVIGLKVSPSTGTILVKTDEPKTRYTDVARFEHARALPPEPVAPAAPAGIDAAAFAEFQEYKAFLASRQ